MADSQLVLTGRVEAPRLTLDSRALIVNAGWTFIGNTTYAACQWAILSVIAKLTDAVSVGTYAFAVAIAMPPMMLASMNLRSVQATDATGRYSFEEYLTLRLITTFTAIAAVIGLCLISHYAAGLALMVVGMSLCQGLEAISDVYYGRMQLAERMDRIGQSMVGRGALSIASMAACLMVTHSVAVGTAALVLSRAVMLFAWDARFKPCPEAWEEAGNRRRAGSVKDILRRQASLVWLALPLGLVLMLVSLTTNVPRYFIEHYAGMRDLGVFSAAASLLAVGSTIANSLGQAATPRLAKLYSAGRIREFAKATVGLSVTALMLGAAGLTLAVLIGKEVVAALFRPEYAQRMDVVIALLSVSPLFYLAIVLGYALTATRSFKAQVPLALSVTAASAGASALLIRPCGLVGAAYAIMLASIVQVGGELWLLIGALKRRSGEPMPAAASVQTE